jgi:hypothetical protein
MMAKRVNRNRRGGQGGREKTQKMKKGNNTSRGKFKM